MFTGDHEFKEDNEKYILNFNPKGPVTGRIMTVYPIYIRSDMEELLVFQSEPVEEIRLKGKKISIEKLIELLKKIEYNGE